MEKNIDYYDVARQANGIRLDTIMDVLGTGYSYDNVDWERMGSVIYNSVNLLSKYERKFINGMAAADIKKDSIFDIIKSSYNDYYFVGQECVLGMEKDEDKRMLVCGVIRGLLDGGFEDMLIRMCKGSKAFSKIFEDGKKDVDEQG